MRVGRFCNRYNLATLISVFTLGTPAFAAPISTGSIIEIAPLLVIFGALVFGIFSAIYIRHLQKAKKASDLAAIEQIASMRSKLDNYEVLLAGLPQIVIIWPQEDSRPSIHGQSEIVFATNNLLENIANFSNWLSVKDAQHLNNLVNDLKANANIFEVSLTGLNGHILKISGHVLGGRAALRIRRENLSNGQIDKFSLEDNEAEKFILSSLTFAAFICNNMGEIIYTNPAFSEISPKINNTKLLEALKQARAEMEPVKKEIKVLSDDNYMLSISQNKNTYIGFIKPKTSNSTSLDKNNSNQASFEYIDAISTAIIVFDDRQKIIHFNKSFCDLWDVKPEWLKSGLDEKALLNHLRTKRQLPITRNYKEWRDEHLSSYKLEKTRKEEWHLPDGRLLSVSAVPTSSTKGVIYIYEDLSKAIALEAQNNALMKVQRETLNSLSEGVAVFGTNGLLTLSNPSLSFMWKLPMNELGEHPHIDKIAKTCAKAMPDDGAQIWNSLKSAVFDLSPKRADKSGRLKLSDGRLIEYSVTRLPDGQTMMTFIDVTQSASFETMLKERNDALVIADRLKDTFVQNVSYELRTPLTDIIGFTDMLISDETGSLNQKQRDYSQYIRASSQTLAVLIDNILDLTHADAGILELDIKKQDIAALVDSAKAGIVGMLNSRKGEVAVNLEVKIDEKLPDFYADGTRIVQVLYNLLSNAIRFSDPGSQISLNITSRNERIIFTIEDEGIGISQEMQTALFKRFESEGEQGQQRGAGLGLAIVKTFVNLHQGTVSLESRKPKGTKVIVSIPSGKAQLLSAK